MRPRLLPALLVPLLAAGCDVRPIDDGSAYGPLTTVRDGFGSCFLLELPDGGTALVDACNQPGADRLGTALHAAGSSRIEVEDVLITHGHGDHVGGLPALARATARVHPADHELAREEGDLGDRPLAELEEGVTALGGLEVEVFHVPGHTAGNLVLLVDGVLVMGDTAVAGRDGSVRPPPRFFSEDPDAAEAALADLALRLQDRAAEIEWVLFSHSGAVQGFDALSDYAAAFEAGG